MQGRLCYFVDFFRENFNRPDPKRIKRTLHPMTAISPKSSPIRFESNGSLVVSIAPMQPTKFKQPIKNATGRMSRSSWTPI